MDQTNTHRHDQQPRRSRWLRAPRLSPAAPGRRRRVIGRIVLWGALGLVMFRGVSDIFGGGDSQPLANAATEQTLPENIAWPGIDARAFAEEFAAEYLSWSVKDETLATRLAPYLGSGVEQDLGLVAPREGQRRTVRATAATNALVRDANHALITVAATTNAGRVRLTVPVARDGAGRLAVYDYPSIAEPRPAEGATTGQGPGDVRELRTSEPAIDDIVDRFVSAYLAGHDHDLEVLLAPGASVTALRRRHRLVEVLRLHEVGDTTAQSRTVMATVRAREVKSGLQLTLRYRIRLHKGDRWSVAAIDSTL